MPRHSVAAVQTRPTHPHAPHTSPASVSRAVNDTCCQGPSGDTVDHVNDTYQRHRGKPSDLYLLLGLEASHCGLAKELVELFLLFFNDLYLLATT